MGVEVLGTGVPHLTQDSYLPELPSCDILKGHIGYPSSLAETRLKAQGTWFAGICNNI